MVEQMIHVRMLFQEVVMLKLKDDTYCSVWVIARFSIN
jgi:hypothetical protein